MICKRWGGAKRSSRFSSLVSNHHYSPQITRMAYAQVMTYGMSDFGPVSYGRADDNRQQLQKPYSEETARQIDDQVRKIIDHAYERTLNLLTEKKAEVEKVAKLLLEKEVIGREDMVALLGPRPFEEKNSYIDFLKSKDGEEVVKKEQEPKKEGEKPMLPYKAEDC